MVKKADKKEKKPKDSKPKNEVQNEPSERFIWTLLRLVFGIAIIYGIHECVGMTKLKSKHFSGQGFKSSCVSENDIIGDLNFEILRSASVYCQKGYFA